MSVGAEAVVRGFLFDANRCTGCNACELACSTENELGWGKSWRHVVDFNPEGRAGVPGFHLSLACNHCDDAPCMEQCPALAIRRDPATDAVLIDDGMCIGCGYCSWVCPYDAPRFDHGRGVMAKCTSCNHRLVDGLTPACAEACPTGALGFGALEGPVSLPGFPNTPARPRIRFQPLRADARPVETTWTPPQAVVDSFAAARPPEARIISLRAERPLWLFTLGVAGMVGPMLAAALTGKVVPLVPFAAVALGALAVSTLHLGRRARAWRAMANVRRSRLSREIFVFGLFLASAVPVVAWSSAPRVWTWVSAALGVAALFTVDRVYDPVRPPGGRLRLHSADVLLTGPLLATLLLPSPVPFTVLALTKLVLYAARWVMGGRSASGAAWAVAGVVRVAGLLVPLGLAWWVGSPGPWGAALLVVAEALDRAEFYEELRVPTPRAQARRDAASWLAGPPRPAGDV